MASNLTRTFPLPSLLDRFLIDEPHTEVSAKQATKLLHEAVRRHVEWMLNSRRVSQPLHDPELQSSLLNWGLPDVTAFAVRSKTDRTRIQRVLTDTITLMEPRLREVRVTIDETKDKEHALRFHVQAVLVCPPCRDRITFATVMDLATGVCSVKDEAE